MGGVWILFWHYIAYDKDQMVSVDKSGASYTSISAQSASNSEGKPPSPQLPRRSSASTLASTSSLLSNLMSPAEVRAVQFMLSSPPCLAVCFTQFSLNLCHYALISWLPTYLTIVYGVSQKELSFVALPYICMGLFGGVGGTAADYLVGRGMSLTRVRKSIMLVSCGGAALCIVLFSVAPSVIIALVCICVALSFMSLCTGGFEASSLDIASPSLAGTFKSVSNTCGALSGFLAMPYTTLILWLLRGSWRGVFGSLAFFQLTGMAVFVKFSTAERLLVDELSDSLEECPRSA
jgi:MFS transporter, ACS family, solute carrier family 17 (sodium-dependent inorganic phosphate cotransporter), other